MPAVVPARINGDRYRFRECGQRGFTLLELTLVSAILGIVAVAALPNLSSSDPSRLDLAALEIADAMRFARGEAIRTGVPHGFRQEISQKRIRVMHPDMADTPATLVYDVYHPVSKKLYVIDLNTEPFVMVTDVSRTTMFLGTCNPVDDVYFDANGTPWCVEPRSVLVQQFAVTLAVGSLSRVVTLDGITGRVTIQ